MLSSGDTSQMQGQTQTQSEGQKMILQSNDNQRKTSVPVLTSDKIEFKVEKVRKDKE